MHFRTQIPISKSNFPIDYTSRIVSLGSCFAVNIAEKLDYYKFQNSVNPFGILFHPLAIEKLIELAVSKFHFSEKDIFFHNEHWHSYDAHSDLSNSDPLDLFKNLNETTSITRQNIEEATHIIITLGTAWVYRNLESNTIVANCHKVPQNQFEKEILSVEEIGKSLENIISACTEINKKVQIIFTISPVRHIKDGFVENQISKSHLIAAVHQAISNHSLNTNYFPSYEIMMDELRDYRFYTSDMLHPTPIAIDYIWEGFNKAWISDSALPIMEEVASIQKGREHRPFNPNSESHLKFESRLIEKTNRLVLEYPFMKF